MQYNISKGQLITLWVFGVIVWFWSIEALANESSFALPIFFIIPAGLIYYSIGWRNKNKKPIPTKPKNQISAQEDEKKHDHNICETTNRKYRKHGIFWLVAPTAFLILTLVAYSITNFIGSASELNSSLLILIARIINVILGLVGVIAVISIFIGIPLGIINLSKRKSCLGKFDQRSGQGDASTVPEEIKHWNWGAFIFGWIWGVANDVWIAFLTLIPVVNLVMMVYLGVKGNELAWRKRKWESVEKFHQSQKKWAVAVVVYLSLVLVICFVNVVVNVANSSNSQLENQAIEELYLKASFVPEINDAYGEVLLAAQDDSVTYEEYIEQLGKYIDTLRNIYQQDQNALLLEAINLYEQAKGLYEEAVFKEYDLEIVNEANDYTVKADAKINKYITDIQKELIETGRENALK